MLLYLKELYLKMSIFRVASLLKYMCDIVMDNINLYDGKSHLKKSLTVIIQRNGYGRNWHKVKHLTINHL